MARAFLLHLMRAYLFANGEQMVSLKWLTLFQDFGEAWRANWRQACLTYLYSTLDTLSRGTLWRLVGPWKLLEISSVFTFSPSLVARSLANCIALKTVILHLLSCICHLANCYLTSNLWFVLLFVAIGGQVWPYNSGHRPSSEQLPPSEGPPCQVDF